MAGGRKEQVAVEAAGPEPAPGADPAAGRAAPRRPRVALVLGSGGARGYAHIGVIEALEQRGYDIVAIAGTSMGAVIGGIHAAGHLATYKAWVEGIDTFGMLRLIDPAFRLGAIQGDKVFGRIREMIGEITIESLPIEFTAVATDLINQQEVWFRQGPLNQAIRASAAIPSLFTPVLQNGRMLVDGALLNPLPITPVLSSQADLIVAVNLNGPPSSRYRLPEQERPPAMRERLDGLIAALESRLRFRRVETEQSEDTTVPITPAASPGSISGDAHGAANPPGASAAPGLGGDFGAGAGLGGPASMLELIDLSLEAMQNALTQYKIAGYSPHVLVNVPKRICRFFEFYRARELIALGHEIANDTLDAWEREEAALRGRGS